MEIQGRKEGTKEDGKYEEGVRLSGLEPQCYATGQIPRKVEQRQTKMNPGYFDSTPVDKASPTKKKKTK